MSGLLTVACIKWYKKQRGCSIVIGFLVANIIILILMLIQDLTKKVIGGIWLLCTGANYINFLGMMYLLRNLKTNEGEALKKRTDCYFIFMNAMYGLSLVTAFIPKFGPTCTATRMYPPCMNLSSFLFLINCVYHHVMHKKQYGLKWDSQLVCDTKNTHSIKESWDKQHKTFICFQSCVAVLQIFIQIIGRLSVHGHSNLLGCAEGGYMWISTSTFGSLFVTFHIMVVVMQAVMIEKVFYAIPHHAGFFDF